jgi:hypothetical protein
MKDGPQAAARFPPSTKCQWHGEMKTPPFLKIDVLRVETWYRIDFEVMYYSGSRYVSLRASKQIPNCWVPRSHKAETLSRSLEGLLSQLSQLMLE